MTRTIYLTLAFTIATITGLSAQERFDVDVIYRFRSDFGLGYNFLAGDNDSWQTTIRGFGSGFFDIFTGRHTMEVLYFGYDKVHLTLGAGVAINKYRMSDPIVLFEEDGAWNWKIDDDPNRTYGSGFFNNDKSKFVTTYAVFPAYLNFELGDWYLTLTGAIDVYLSGKHKLKYTQDGDRQKEVIRNQRFKNTGIARTKWSVGSSISHQPSGFTLGFNYVLTPFWEDNPNFPDLNEVRVSASYSISQIHRRYGSNIDW